MYIRNMKTYKASKTQLRKLTELNVTEAPRDYNHAAELLEARGWNRSGTVEDVRSEDEFNDQDFDR